MRGKGIARVRVTKEFSFEAAHLLRGYDGACANVHGHSYRLFVTLRGYPCDEPGSPKLGMLLDFSVLKRLVSERVVQRLDHALMVRAGSWPLADELALDLRVERFDFQPTCENLLGWMANQLLGALPPGVELYALRLYETATSYAEWYAADQA